jgi:hypothetical protein
MTGPPRAAVSASGMDRVFRQRVLQANLTGDRQDGDSM